LFVAIVAFGGTGAAEATGSEWLEIAHSCILTVCQNYRYWIIWRCPTVRYLDFAKVRDVERKKAKELFGSAEEPTELASKVRLCIPPLKPVAS
jgi:hypothetical protein